MKTFATFSFARTGSTFFHSFFVNRHLYSLNTMEFFNAYPANQYQYIRQIYTNNGIKIPKSYRVYEDRLFNKVFTLLWSTKFKDPYERSLAVGRANPYSLKMLFDTTEALKTLQYKYFFYKIIFQEVCKKEWLDGIVKHTDEIIINYRKSILDSYISLHRARLTDTWQLNPRWHVGAKYNPKYDAAKIHWELDQFKSFVETYNQYYNDILSSIKSHNKSYTVINYENFCNVVDKQDYLSSVLHVDKEAIETDTNFIKQSRSTKHEDAFSNSEDFIRDKDAVDEIANCKIFN
jgi:hypothetical protein